jgi:alcohol dehydrogenase class IV
VLTVESTRKKTVVFSPAMLPRVAILDPELTRSMPPLTTAATGVDALTHCLEARVATGDHPMADAIANGGIELVVRYLERAVNDGTDLEARGAMMKAAMMGAVAFQKGLGACHSLAHPLSAEFGTHHGLANALCLPAVVRFNLPSASEAYERAALAFGARSVAELPDRLVAFRARLGLPGSLAEAGIQRSEVPRLASLAFEDACHQSNPRPCSAADLAALYEASF